MGGLVGRAMGGMLSGVARQLQQQQQQVRSGCIPECLTGMHWCSSPPHWWSSYVARALNVIHLICRQQI